jgi:hypothetical protein
MDPEASKETEIDGQISLHHILAITLTPETVIAPNSNEEQLPLRKSSKRPFAMMSIYISSVFGTYVFYNFCSVLSRRRLGTPFLPLVFFATNIIQAQNWRITFASFVMLLLSTREGSSSYLNMLSRRKNGSQRVNLVGRDAKRSGSEDPILACECLYAFDLQTHLDQHIVAGAA